ncbi:MAG: GFA family protein [Myxococcota bacterium]
MKRNGQCMCGAVTYTASDIDPNISACHCKMCQRWAGGPYFSAVAKTIEWEGEDYIKVITSSAWAERAFCTECGTGLFYRITAPGEHEGMTALAVGTLDDTDGFTLEREWFFDKRCSAYQLEGERLKVTAEQAKEMFGG